MQPTEKPQFVGMLADVMAYYRQDTSPFLINVWWDACESVSFEEVAKAINAHVKDAERGQFAPKIADIVRALVGTTTDRAALAWGKVLDSMGSVGAYSDVVFDDAAIHAAIEDCGGWPKVCRTDLAELSYLQHRFCQAHKAYVGRGTFSYPRCLIGQRSADYEYTSRGMKVPTPAVVGDRATARLVYKGGNVGGKTAIAFTPLRALESVKAALIPMNIKSEAA